MKICFTANDCRNWGCGVFGGYHDLKAILQLMAAAEAGVNVHYCTFGVTGLAPTLIELVAVLRSSKVTVGMYHSHSVLTQQDKFMKQLKSWLNHSISLHQKRMSLAKDWKCKRKKFLSCSTSLSSGLKPCNKMYPLIFIVLYVETWQLRKTSSGIPRHSTIYLFAGLNKLKSFDQNLPTELFGTCKIHQMYDIK